MSIKLKEINIKNRTYYFFDDMVNTKDIDPKQMKSNTKIFLLTTLDM